jgi:hypothetical protein
MKTVKTNSKQVREQIKQHVIDRVMDENGESFKTFEEAKNRLLSEFKRVANYPNNSQRFPNNQDRFSDYLNGLPFNFEFTYYGIKEYLNGLGINPTGKKYSASVSLKRYHALIWREIQN